MGLTSKQSRHTIKRTSSSPDVFAAQRGLTGQQALGSQPVEARSGETTPGSSVAADAGVQAVQELHRHGHRTG